MSEVAPWTNHGRAPVPRPSCLAVTSAYNRPVRTHTRQTPIAPIAPIVPIVAIAARARIVPAALRLALALAFALAPAAISAGAASAAAPPGAAGAAAPPGAPVPLILTSTAFANQGEIPARYSCEVAGGSAEVSPPLAWSGVPGNARSLVLIVDDPDAPDPQAPKTTWVHWVLYDLPSTARGLTEGVAAAALLAGTRQGNNDWGRTGYGAPCPPVGRHRYFFKLYALDTPLPDLGTPDKKHLEQAIQGHVVARAQLVGTYQKQKSGQ